MSCGATLAHWAAKGAEVRLVVVNAGDEGSPDPATDPAELTERRAGEVRAAAAVLGLAGVELLGLPDGEVTNDLALRDRLVGLVRRHRPEIVVCPDPTAVFFGDSYVNYRDHRVAGWAVVDAVAPRRPARCTSPRRGRPTRCGPCCCRAHPRPTPGWKCPTRSRRRRPRWHATRAGWAAIPPTWPSCSGARLAETGAQAGVDHAESFRRLRFA